MQKLNATIAVNGGLSAASASISTTVENLIPAMNLAIGNLTRTVFSDPILTRSASSRSRRSSEAA